ncbi:hypothetical protein M3I54_43110 [Paraburkholderia sp. CNPSo 3274]|uniref:hypothetical protein n=1 Tax=Paraburkholderia sp. CNPSo 3274 TaxID=2940932 RepID=UPI0020B851F9|nr:hypothetical protein [Paraburkholderia sp. CNPSo 3274]MCP3713548.1 hypothetical protein [Paraburkholderia sp. CNPSo 3274]
MYWASVASLDETQLANGWLQYNDPALNTLIHGGKTPLEFAKFLDISDLDAQFWRVGLQTQWEIDVFGRAYAAIAAGATPGGGACHSGWRPSSQRGSAVTCTVRRFSSGFALSVSQIRSRNLSCEASSLNRLLKYR